MSRATPAVPRHAAASLLTGLAAHLASAVAALYLVGFLAARWVPRSVDAGGPVAPWAAAIAVDLLLLAAFAVPHSMAARPWFKARLARVVAPPLERSAYSAVASLTLGALFWQWRPIPAPVWDVTGTPWAGVAWALFWLGWALCAASVLATNLSELTGLRQAWLHARGRAHTPVPLTTSRLYGAVRHPLYLGFLLAVWATPRLTVGHLVFAAANTLYVLVAVRYEERDLLRAHGAAYAAYRARVPMIVPRVWRPRTGRVRSAETPH